jgi:chromatin remodeling complex protein RSC6
MSARTSKKNATTRAGERATSRALHKPLQPSKELAAVVGPASLPGAEVVSKVWDYIRSHNLQNPENDVRRSTPLNRREILA